MTRRIRMGLSLVCAVVACLLSIAYANAARQDALSERSEALARYGGEVASVVVASGTLQSGDVLDAYNCEEREWLVDLLPDDALLTVEDAYGQTVSGSVSSGSVITTANIARDSSSFDIPSGRVALTIPMSDRLGIYKSIEIGSVLAAYVIDGETTRLVSSNVVVLAQDSSTSTGTITLALLPDDVSAIFSASADNTLRLVKPADDVVTLSSAQGPLNVDAVDAQVVEEES